MAMGLSPKHEGKKAWNTYESCAFFFLYSVSNWSIKRGTKPVVSSAVSKYFFSSWLKAGSVDCAMAVGEIGLSVVGVDQ